MKRKRQSQRPLYIVLVSIHGLIRGHDLELGRDADTGGQTKYVVELARALGEREDVERVDLVTRLVEDPQVSPDYAEPVEQMCGKSRIVRIRCGEQGYLRKEMLWDSLESFSDNVLGYLKLQPRLPDVLHSHYADAGYVASRLSLQLGIPLVHTGHSLGLTKRKRLMAGGVKQAELESAYNISRRIEAEEMTLGVAERVITSTRQEIEQQYALYDFYQPDCMLTIPPGTDTKQFYPPRGDEKQSRIAQELRRFLKQPQKPLILALSRPDPKKNIVTLVEAYGESEELQKAANLVVVAGNRDDIQEMEPAARGVLNEILLAIDKHDLYGKVAYPKHHRPEEVAELYRLAAAGHGVFVNPALTEPFGLTLIEAAACGLPIVATEDGGPVDIIGNCANGYLIDPLDKIAMAASILELLNDREIWRRLSRNGIRGVRQHYSWKAHAENYLAAIRPLADKATRPPRIMKDRRRTPSCERVFISSLDLSLTGDGESLQRLMQMLQAHRREIMFGLATGRRLDDALAVLRQHRIREPDFLIASQGTEIYYGAELNPDEAWERHINHLWNPAAVRELLEEVPGLEIQPKRFQSPFKLSYYIDPGVAEIQQVRQLLLRNEQAVNIVFSFGQFLDVLPIRASKGLALRWVASRLDFALERTLVAGVTAADTDMLMGNTMGAVVDSHHLAELSGLVNMERVYFSGSHGADGIMEAMEHYAFFEECGGKA